MTAVGSDDDVVRGMAYVRARRQWTRRLIAVALLSAVVVGANLLSYGTPAVAAVNHPLPLPAYTPISEKASPRPVPAPRKMPAPAKSWKAPAVTWPAAASAAVNLAASVPGSAAVRAGSLPLRFAPGRGAPPAVQATVVSDAAAQAAGVDGLLMAAAATTSAGGKTQVTVDTSGFDGAYGGDFASRLHLVQLPACALTTPSAQACRMQTPMPTTIDAQAHTLTASLTLPAAPAAPIGANLRGANAAENDGAAQLVVFAATSSPSGDAGDYTATSLKPGGSWQVSGNSGSFAYSYPIPVPPVPGSQTPSIALSYDSQSVDGEQVATNSQSSWIGDGWDYSPGYIEESFIDCHDNPQGKAKDTYDNCYAGQILHVSFGAESGDLVYDPSVPTHWKLSTDDGTRVQQLTASGTNGTYDGDYFKITTPDGTQYFFGLNHLPGYSSDSATPPTNSAWTEPVYSPYSGDPCYGKTNHVCTMAWRWNLDYVVDTHHNATAYYYTPETNYYGQNGGTTGVSYVRGGVLNHISYGLVDPSAYASAPAQVVFGSSQRCVATTGGGCSVNNIDTTPSNWPDVPYDQNCKSGAVCDVHSPTFWSRLRLTSITTKVWAGGTNYTTVDTWNLQQSFPDPQDGTTPAMWLTQIQRTGGSGGTAITLPPVTFAMTVPMPNRIDGIDGAPAMNHYRIADIETESGEQIGVTYTNTTDHGPACTAPVTVTPSADTSMCYPVYWTPTGDSSPVLDWFAKYVVAQVQEQDTTLSGNAPLTTSYEYGTPAWHYDDNELVKAAQRTYGQWRGFDDVKTRTGAGADAKTLTESIYYRGMGGTVTLAGNVSVPGAATTVTDDNLLSGQPRETIDYNGDGGPVNDAAVTDYWVSPATATRSRSGLPDLTANMTGDVATYTTTAITSGPSQTWRSTETDTTHDTSTGLPTVVYDHGDITKTDQATCIITTYAPTNTSANIIGLPAEVEKDAGPCGGSGVNGLTAPTYSGFTKPDDLISDTRTFYDDPSFATSTWPQAAPAIGNASVTQQACDDTSPGCTYTGSYGYQISERKGYDSFGRVIADYDADGNLTASTYTQTNGLASKLVTTEPKATPTATAMTTSTTLDPTRGLALVQTDENGLTTTEKYDALGRLTGVWMPGRSTALGANEVFSYQVNNTAPSAVTTKNLEDGGGYRTQIILYDALYRQRQIQSQNPVGGRNVTDTYYDSRGWAYQTNNAYYWDTNQPSTTLVDNRGADQLIPDMQQTTYDGLGNPVLVQGYKLGHAVPGETTRTIYGGDRTTTIPPAGGQPTTTITDALGRTTEVDAYTAPPAIDGNQVSGAADAITYHYDIRGNQDQVIDADGNIRHITHNLAGQQIAVDDPDSGLTQMTYDPNGNLLTSQDSRTKTSGQPNIVSFAYDGLGRKTAENDGPDSSSPLLASWTYDAAIPEGKHQLASSTVYDSSGAYTETITGYNNHYEQTGISYTVPSSLNILSSAYSIHYGYSTTDGLLRTTTYPALGGLPAETVAYTYDSLNEASGMGSSLGTYISSTNYTPLGDIAQTILGTSPNTSTIAYNYDQHTDKLTDTTIDQTVQQQRLDEVGYTYDPNGDITATTDTRYNTTSETQCYDYNTIGELTTAWTATDNCTADLGQPGASNTTVGGISPYWSSWTYDNQGNQLTETDHATPGLSGDTILTYTYNGDGTGQPDTQTGQTATGPGGTTTSSYHYDTAGDMTARNNTATGNQTLTWNDQGNLATVTGDEGTSSYVYDADGSILVQRDPGSVTLYLPDEQLTLDTSSGTITGQRYYTTIGAIQLVRTGTANSAYNYEITNQNSTAQLVLDNTAGNPTWRSYTPYGAPRGTPPASWPDNHGFLGKPTDTTTGLTIIGVRQYDPDTGRFVSTDPDFSDQPVNIGGYAYAGDDPINNNDPTGKCWVVCSVWNGIKSGAKAVGGVVKKTVSAAIHDPIGFLENTLLGAGVFALATTFCAATAGLGCVVMAGAVSGAVVGGTDYAADVVSGKTDFSLPGLAKSVLGGAAVGGLTAGTMKAGGDIWEGIFGGTEGAADGSAAAGGVATLKASDVRFSQETVNGLKEKIDQILENGRWAGSPIDVVKMSDGGLTSVDNTRLLAARMLKVDVEARIHAYNEPISDAQAVRFPARKTNTLPTTWGEAVENRIGRQSASFRSQFAMGSENFPRYTA